MKSGKNLKKRLAVFSIVVIGVSLFMWLWWVDSISAVDPDDTAAIEFSVIKEEGVRSIVTRLAQQNLIRSPTGFFILVKLKRLDTKLQAGNYRLSPSMDAQTIAQELTHGVFDRKILIREGLRNEEIAQILSRELDIPEAEFLKAAKIGYMFPDTYYVSGEATAGALAEQFMSTFNGKITPKITDAIKVSGFTFDQILTLASLVEREGRSAKDRPKIAGILRNRLEVNHPLQVDATLQYSLGYQPFEKTYWKHILTNEDKQVESPYNTYKYPGLPPGPICNPGIESILAAIYPEPSDYFYYLHDPGGNVHYAKTLEEHNANIRKYLQ